MVIFIRRKVTFPKQIQASLEVFWPTDFQPTSHSLPTLNLGVERFAEFLGPKLCPTSPTKKRTKARHLGLCKIIGGIFKISKLGETFSSWVKTSPKTNGFVHPKQRPLKV